MTSVPWSVGLCAALLVGCTAKPAPKAPQDGWTPGLEQLVPAGADLVARIDWKRAREADATEQVVVALRDAGVSAAVLDAVEGCLSDADMLRLAFRLGPDGLNGDVMAVVTGGAKPSSSTQVPCGAKGWKHVGTTRHLDVFEPTTPSSDRSAGAMMLRSREGAVAVVTPGQVDALLRVLRTGPDADRLEAVGQGVLVLEGRIREAMLPEPWTSRAPSLAGVAKGILQQRISVQVRGDRIELRARLTYADKPTAEQAGERLRDVRNALLESEREVFRAVAKSMHATLQGDLLRLEVAIPRSVASVETPQEPVEATR